MRKFTVFFVIGILVVIAYLAYLVWPHKENGSVEGRIIDALSNDSVWQAWIVVDGKSTLKFEDTRYRLTGIEPGTYTLKATAPNYTDFSKKIEIKDGKNVVNISMKGIEVPDLSEIIAFTETSDKGILIEIRLLDSEKTAIEHHPAIPLRMEGELFLRMGDSSDHNLGKKIFSGPIEVFWDPEENLAKNKGIIPWDKIKTEPKGNLYGLLRLNIHTDQGSFSYLVKDTELFPQANQ